MYLVHVFLVLDNLSDSEWYGKYMRFNIDMGRAVGERFDCQERIGITMIPRRCLTNDSEEDTGRGFFEKD